MGEILKMYIPSSVETLAVPANMLSFFLSEQKGAKISVIKKDFPYIDHGCGARHWYQIQLVMLPRGGILMPSEGERKLKYGKIDSNGNISGYLVFEKIKDSCKQDEKGEICEWKLSKDREPQAFVYVIHDYKYSRTCSLCYDDISGDILAYLEDSTKCATMGVASLVLILPADRPAIIRYKKHTGEYRGECWDEEVKQRISWNNGDVKVEDFEEVPQEDII